MKSALILYPHQLYSAEHLPQVDTVVMVEDPYYFGVDQQYPIRLHKQKLILHRASMRRYAEEVIWPLKIDVDYVELDVFMQTSDLLKRLRKFEQVFVFDPIDDVVVRRLLAARREQQDGPHLEFLPSPNFYLKEQEVRAYFGKHHRDLFADFYQWQRERFNVLIGEDYKPVGGKWSFDSDNRQKLPKDTPLPTFGVFGSNQWVEEAVKYVNEHFPNNPGSTDFIWPTSREEALSWLHDFIEKRLDNFGPYQDAMDKDAAWTYHSALSSSMNIGLLQPDEVVGAALDRHQRQPVPLASLEGFVRQVMGWREYVRGIYITRGEPMRSANNQMHKRKLTNAWYDGTLGIPPYDDMVQKVNQHAYAHHIERLMIAGNLMMLCEIDPDDVFKWFSEMFIDAYDWVMVPNIYGMSQYADGGSMVTKPYISSSNYVLQMSHYSRDTWCDVWDGLFWRYIEKHKVALGKNPRMRVMVQRLNQLDPDRKRIISYRAEDFLNTFTS